MVHTRFRVLESSVRRHLVALKLIEMGDLESATRYQSNEVPTKLMGDFLPELDPKDIALNMKRVEAKYELHRKSNPRIEAHTKHLQRDVIAKFFRLCTSALKCSNCGASSPKLRKDGFTKIYQRSLTQKLTKELESKNLKMKVDSRMHDLGTGEVIV
jgi:hypothetical protein